MTRYRDKQEAGEFAAPAKDLGGLTKAELQAEAARRGIDVAASWSKDEIRQAIEDAG